MILPIVTSCTCMEKVTNGFVSTITYKRLILFYIKNRYTEKY